MNMISGEQFQLLSEISFCTETDCIKLDQIKAITQNLHKISTFNQDSIKQYQKFFVYTDFIEDFMHRFGMYLESNTILITHNSDHYINETHLPYIENPKITKWFCQNRYINHPKLISLPIGLANSQWPHGNRKTIERVRNENNTKVDLVYKNFDIGTNRSKRSICNAVTASNGINMSPTTNNEDYWRSISRSRFVIAPHGNGVDCHRIWECLYLRSIPIVIDHECFSQFKHLPILFVRDWSEVTIDKMREFASLMSVPEIISELDIKFWANKLQ